MNIPAALSAAPVTSVLSGLAPGTTYHVRVRAINEEGSAAGGDMTFATTALPVTVPPVTTLSAEAHFSWGFLGSRTVLKKVTVSKLKGGETITVTCSSKSKGCKFKSKTYKKVKKGTKSFASLFGRKRPLKTGAKVVVRVTIPRRGRVLHHAHRRQAQEGPEDQARKGEPLERDVAVLAARTGLTLGQQRLKCGDDLRAGLVGDDHVVHVAALGRRVGVREAGLVVVDQLLAALVGRG